MKQLLKEFPQEALAFFAGEEGRRLSQEARVVHLRQEQISERLDKGFREVDSLMLVEQPGGNEALIFLVEEEARPSRAAVFKTAEYVLLIAQWLEREYGLTAIVPVIVTIGDGAMNPGITIETKLRCYLRFEYVHCHIATLDAEDALRSGNLAAVSQIMNMRYEPERRVALCAAALLFWQRKTRDIGQAAKYGQYIMGCARMDQTERLELKATLARAEGGQVFPTLFDDYFDEGLAKGRSEGLAKGRAEGLATGRVEDLLDLLQARSLQLSDAQRERIRSCSDPGTLRRWLIRAATATSTESIFADN